VDILMTLGRTLGFSMAAGVNLYATVGILGLAARYGWVALPPQFAVFDHDVVIYSALALFVIEFVADKVPWLDSLWDGVHTAIRPLGGALIAVTTLGEASPVMQGMVALLGGGLAASSHLTKAGARVTVNTSPEPISNWTLSLAEDGFVFVLALLALKFPLLALGAVVVAFVVCVCILMVIARTLRRFFVKRRRALLGGVPA
jgi:hypothetical protein